MWAPFVFPLRAPANSAARSRAPGTPVLVLLLGIGGATLTATPWMADPFTSVKWYALAAAAVVVLCTTSISASALVMPASMRSHRWTVASFGALAIANTVRSGLPWSLDPLLGRFTFLTLAACAYAAFTLNGGSTRVAARGLAIPLTLVTILGLAQVAGLTRAWGLEPLFGLHGGDGRSATFGNVNMAAQFVGFSSAFLIAHGAGNVRWPRRPALLPGTLLSAAGVVYMWWIGARSALLALATSVVVTALLVPHPRWARLPKRVTAGAAGIFALGLAVAALTAAFSSPLKAESIRLRARLWAQTAKLIADHPLGVGSGNFVHAFLPYQLADDRLRSEAVVYASPHNEVLRALAEEGVVWCALAAYLLFRLGAAVRKRARADGGYGTAVVIAAGASFLAVESLFQFPFALAFGALAAALTLGLALSYVQPGEAAATPQARRWIPRLAALVLAGVGTVALACLVLSDYWTATAPGDAARQSRACALNPRNLRACLNAAWLDASGGHRRRARQRLAAVLDRSPHYHPAIALLADDAFAQGDARAGCFYTWIYDALFEGHSSRHDVLAARCPPRLLEGFAREVKVPGYERFPMTVPAAGP